ALGMPGGRRAGGRPLRAGGELLRHGAARDLLRAAHADLRRGRVHRLPVHADVRRLGRDPGRAGAAPDAGVRNRHAAAELLCGPGIPGARLSGLPRARRLAFRQGAGGDPRERGPRAVPRLQRAALQDGRLPDLRPAHRHRRGALSRALGVRLEVDAVSRSFGALAALTEVSLTVREGEVFSVIGPNGAGKSTLFNVVTGIHAPTAGRVRFGGREISGLAPEAINRLGIAKTFQITNVFPEISVFALS